VFPIHGREVLGSITQEVVLMRKLVNVSLLVAALVAGTVGYFAIGSAEARPQYIKQFVALYPAMETEAKTGAKCSICHPENDKKMRNAYAMELGQALGKPNVKDAAAIDAALMTAGAKQSASGETYAEIFAAGKLP
jgi:hypothetical protein